MSTHWEALTAKRRQEQDVRGYASSSRWYVGLSYAIEHIKQTEVAATSSDKFLNAWKAIYNLYMLDHRPGEIENDSLSRWVKDEMKDAHGVRGIALETPTELLQTIDRDKKTLLWNAEERKWRDAHELVEAWLAKRQKGQNLSPEKATTYLFLIGRDLRNALSHPTLNPNARNTKAALTLACELFLRLAVTCIETTIEHPIEGTTGKTTAYRSFLFPFLNNSDSFFSDYYLERLFPDEELGAFPEEAAGTVLKELAKQAKLLGQQLATADSEENRALWLQPLVYPALGLTTHQGVRIVTGDQVFQPSAVVAYGPKPSAEYQGKDAAKDLACLVWELPHRTSLDAVSTDPEFAGLTVIEVAHRALANSDVPWAILTNGRQFRLLAKRTAHKPRCFLELNLDATLGRVGSPEALLPFRYWLGLFSGASFTERDKDGHTRLDRVQIGSDRHGEDIGEELKQNVFGSLEELGEGFLSYLRKHEEEREAWREKHAPACPKGKFLQSDELLTTIYQESLGLMYRLLFLFYAESRNLLPMDDQMYRESYSLESIRDEIISVQDDPDPKRFFGKGTFELWTRLRELFGFVNAGWGSKIPAYNGGLFDREQHEFLERFEVDDLHLARAVDLLSRTRPRRGQTRGEGRKKVTYRDLDVRHLGTIYEGLLEYSAQIAAEDQLILKKGSGKGSYEEYAAVSSLSAAEAKQLREWQAAMAENPDGTSLRRGSKVTGFKSTGSYFLVYGGAGSKRKSSGSYYTPDYIVQYIAETTLGRILASLQPAQNGKTLTSEQILRIRVLDPAMGSAHFLVAATEILARAYGEALIRERNLGGEQIADEAFTHYKRLVAERCIYGVDVNPMAVELAKLSLWLFTMDKGRPLSFLNHHLKPGNSLLGACVEEIVDDPNATLKRDPRQGNLFEQQFKAKIPFMVRDILEIMRKETLTAQDVQAKKLLDKAIAEVKRPFKNLANRWVTAHFGETTPDYLALLARVEDARERDSQMAERLHVFHWELEFPEVFFDGAGNRLDDAGFDTCLGNPPYVRVELLNNAEKDFLKERYEALNDRCDIYVAFIERGVALLSSRGHLGVIVSGQFITADYGSALRDKLEARRNLSLVLDLEPLQVFEGATTYPVVLGCSRSPSQTLKAATAMSVTNQTPDRLENERLFGEMIETAKSTQLKALTQSPWIWVKSLAHDLPEEMAASPALGVSLAWICNISSTLKSGLDSVLTSRILSNGRDWYTLMLDGKETRVAKSLWRPILRASNLSMWTTRKAERAIFFPYYEKDGKYFLREEKDLRRLCGATFAYLERHRDSLEARQDSRKTWRELGRPWYSLHRYGKPDDHAPPRLLCAGEIERNRFALSEGNEVWPCARIIGISLPKVSIKSLQLFLNSDEVWAFIRAKFPPKRGGYRGVCVGDLGEVPCPGAKSEVWERLAEMAGDIDTARVRAEDEQKIRVRVSHILAKYKWS